MGLEYFLFALMLFGMVLIVFFLFFSGKRRCQRAEETEWEDKKKKLMTLYFEVQDMIEAFEKDIKNVSEWIKRQQYDEVKVHTKTALPGESKNKGEALPQITTDQERINVFEPVGYEIVQLHKNGMSEQEIAEKLKVSRNKVKFVLKIESLQK